MTSPATLAHFGLARDPFATSGPERTSPDLFHAALGHEDCLERLRLTVALGLGLGIVTGEQGYGKSAVLAALLDEIAHHPGLTIGVIDDPTAVRTDVSFLRAIAGRLLPEVAIAGRTGLDLTTALLRELANAEATSGADETASGRGVVLAIDAAHGLASNQLDALRALLVPSTAAAESPLAPARLTVLLFGAPELVDKVARKRNLAGRAAMTHALNPLNRRDTAAMIRHRLGVAMGAGDRSAGIFDEAALDAIHVLTGGVPAEIVGLAGAALGLAAAAGRTAIEESIVRAAAGGMAGEEMPQLAGNGNAGANGSAPAPVQARLAGLGPAGANSTPGNGVRETGTGRLTRTGGGR
ncbi:MAG TPA: AAA family ATPase [Thermomicrobiales bacterium]|jgi:general secretion pathway protein A|nr:AAA family ATPase [Thermomicrobiales bacterium]